MDDGDRKRFVKGLVAFNSTGRRSNSSLAQINEPTIAQTPLVDIVAYCLMPNHFHLMLEQRAEHGISEFMHRVGTGYTNYFNKRYGRTGCLLEGPYKIKRMKDSVQQRHLSRYIHLNPLELAGLNWKDRAVRWDEAHAFLSQYPWSSYKSYIGIEHSVFVRPEEGLRYVGGAEEYQNFLRGWVERDWNILDSFELF